MREVPVVINSREGEQRQERRKDTVHIFGLEFDKKINLPGVAALLILMWGLYTGFTSIQKDFSLMSKQHDLMWKHFIMHEKDVTQEELATLFSR